MVRITEASGSSTESWDAAVVDAVRGAKDDIADPIAVEVVRLWADVGARRSLGRYRAQVKIAYRQAIASPSRGRTSGRATSKRTSRAR